METSDLRSRVNTSKRDADPSGSKIPTPISEEDKVSTRIGILDILRVLSGIFLLSSTLSYFVTNESILWGYRPAFTQPAQVLAWFRGPLLLTETDLLRYNGTDTKLPIYIALNGTIYDVSAAPQTYGPGGSYHFFAGRDAARAFVTGCFDTDLTADLRGVEEMYVPLDLDEDPVYEEGDDKGEKKRKRGEWKAKRELAWRKGRERVKQTIEGWQRKFEGERKGYFEVGKVKREVGWEGERKGLCEKARRARPKVTAMRRQVEAEDYS